MFICEVGAERPYKNIKYASKMFYKREEEGGESCRPVQRMVLIGGECQVVKGRLASNQGHSTCAIISIPLYVAEQGSP